MNQPWLMIADAAHAQFYSFDGYFNDLAKVKDGKFEHQNLQSKDLVTTKRGRVSNGFGDARSALERPTDPHEHEKTVFAKSLMHYVQQHQHKFSSIVIVAPPKMLGLLRENTSKEVEKKIVAEIAKELTNQSQEQVVSSISKEINKEQWASVQIRSLNA